MGLTVHIQHSAEIDDLINQYNYFSFLKTSTIPKSNINRWYMNNTDFGYSDQEIYQLQVMFIGKTGYGKSTTLNKIIGRKAFETSDVSVCTKDLYEATYRINSTDKTFLSLCDLPGIGESNYADNHYYDWYRDMLEKSHCVVYVLRADQRDFSVDEILFTQMFRSDKEKGKVILAINYADKIEPLNRQNNLSQEQIKNLNKKINEVSNIFQMPKSNIIYYSAVDNINLDLLVSYIAKKLKKYIL